MKHHWLLKSEPDTFSFDDLTNRPNKTTTWEGVRNYQARNMLRDELKRGDEAFFYHSNCKETGIVGIVKVTREAYPDDTAFDPKSPYYDPKSDRHQPRWFMVDVTYVKRLSRTITLAELKQHHAALDDFALLRKGNRLSVLPVTEAQWRYILNLL